MVIFIKLFLLWIHVCLLLLFYCHVYAEEITETSPSNKPIRFKVGNVTDTSIELTWARPSHPTDDIVGYQLHYMYGEYCAIKTVNNTSASVHYTLSNLQPYTEYSVWVTSSTAGEGDGDNEPSEKLFQRTDVSAPGSPRITNLTCVTSNSFYLQWQRPTMYYNNVDLYYVVYKAENSRQSREVVVNSSRNDIESQVIYNLTENLLYEVQVRGASQSVVYDNHFLVGNFSTPKKIFVASDCDKSFDLLEESSRELRVIFVSGLALGLFILILIICGLVIRRKCFHAAYYYLEESRQVVNTPAFDWNAKTDPPAVTIDEFVKHVSALHADGDIGFSKEYESIQCASLQEQFTSDVSTHPDNKLKNRYLNILAYDHSRVRLVTVAGQNRWIDYINANYIDGFERVNAYIGTQGPLPCTFESFWRMVWEQGVTVIVMITNLVERSRRKCDMYWPKEGSETYGYIQVKLIKEDVLALYTVRTMKISHLKVKRKKCSTVERIVLQFHYTNWHDHGTPDHPLPILSFVNKSSAANLPNSGPIVVHCSAGVGRTGTYIVLDAMLKQIRSKREVNIYSYLKYIRNQRNYLVQTEEQYIFIHDALLEAITFARNALTTECLNFILSPNPDQHHEYWLQFESNYKMVTSFEPKDYNRLSGNKPCNSQKNRSQEFIPLENSRVHLTPKPGVEGSDYINATWLLGFKKLKEFIITQHPLHTTVIDFWQMIWDHNAQTIVLLSSVNEDCGYPAFWPSESETTLDTESFKVKLIEESELDGTVSRDFTVQSLHDDYELTVRLIQPSHTITEISDIVQLINLVQEHHLEYQNGPIVVVDELGGTIAATFCCLSTLTNQLSYDSHADVSIYAKLYHHQRPGIWKTVDDYLMLYCGLNVITTNRGDTLVASPDPYIHINYGSIYANGHAFS